MTKQEGQVVKRTVHFFENTKFLCIRWREELVNISDMKPELLYEEDLCKKSAASLVHLQVLFGKPTSYNVDRPLLLLNTV